VLRQTLPAADNVVPASLAGARCPSRGPARPELTHGGHRHNARYPICAAGSPLVIVSRDTKIGSSGAASRTIAFGLALDPNGRLLFA
jgi:hypothetical protein